MNDTLHSWKAQRPVILAAAGVAAVLYLLFLGVMWSFGRWGGPFVNGLSEEIGEVISQRASDLAAAGMNDEAVIVYREALKHRFEDEPRQRIYTLERLARVLQARGESDSAIEVLEAAYRLDSTYGPVYTVLFEALIGARHYDRALELTNQWNAYTRSVHDTTASKWAKYNEGRVYRDTKHYAEALAAFTESNTLAPSQESAFECAAMLDALGRNGEAVRALDYVLANGNPTYQKKAQELLATIGVSSGAAGAKPVQTR